MKCAKCQSENRARSKFCAACGAPLAILCPKCNRVNRPEGRFCSTCGHVLAEPDTAEQLGQGDSARAPGERRQATVMFSDVSGYTALLQRLDPEEVDSVLIRVKRAATRIVEKHGGVVNRFIGDEVLALFGIPNAEEDDPARAIRAALELHAEI